MTQLTVNLSMDVPDGFVVVLKPRSDGGYELRMQAEVARVVDEMPKPAPKPLSNGHHLAPAQRPFTYMKKSGAAALDVVNDLTQMGEPVTPQNYAGLAGCALQDAKTKLYNLYRYQHLRVVERGTRSRPTVYALA